MKKVHKTVDAQGVSAVKWSYANENHLFTLLGNRQRSGKLYGMLLLVLLTLSFFNPASASDTLNVMEVPHSLIFPEGEFFAGDSVFIEVVLGAVDSNIQDAWGYRIDLNVTEDAVFPTSLTQDHTTTWMMNGTFSDSVGLHPAEDVIELYAERTDDGSETGYGEVVGIWLHVGEDGVTADELVSIGGGVITVENVDMSPFGSGNGYLGQQNNAEGGVGSHAGEGGSLDNVEVGVKSQAGGGVITVENVDMKNAPQVPKLTAYPNPCEDRLNLSGLSDGENQVELIGLAGRVWARVQTGGSMHVTMNVADVNPGVYILRIQAETGEVETRKIWVQ